MDPTVTLTRRELYDLVWSKPMTAIAHEFGVSSVAFAKNCTKLNVPRPGRGYWQQLASGLKPKREPLPLAEKGTPTTIELTRHEKTAGPRGSSEPAPIVEVRGEIRSPHPLVSRLRQELGALTRYGLELRAIRGDGHAVLKVGKGNEKRALLILDAVFKALVARGHEVRFGERYASGRQYALEAIIAGRNVEFWLAERLEQSEYVETSEEKARRITYGSSWAPKFDQSPSGLLVLEADSPWRAHLRHRWRDSEQQRLEERLGEFVLGIEAIAAAWVENDLRLREEEETRARDERDRLAAAARAAHLQTLEEDLVNMAEAADQAEKVRRFLERVGASVAAVQRSDEFVLWFQWAMGYAEKLDPLSQPDNIVKQMTPEAADVD